MMKILSSAIAVFVAVLFSFTLTAAHALRVQGAVATPCDDVLSSLQVAAYARDGRLETSASVTPKAAFTLFLNPTTKTHYILYLLGAIENQYHPIFLQVDPDQVLLSQVRISPLQKPPLVTKHTHNRTTAVLFKPDKPTLAALKRARKRWSLRNLWAYRLQALMLVAAVFIIWFPKFIRDLPQELREELLGEKDTQMGDPNALFKALLSLDHNDDQQATKSKTN